MRCAFPILFGLVITQAIHAQCDDYRPSGSQVFHANDIRTVVNTGADMFWNLYDAEFKVPFKGPTTPNAMFATSVWLGGYDPQGQLHIAAQEYRDDLRQEYQCGPLDANGIPFSANCSDWDHVWSVRHYEILRHLKDFDVNGSIDERQPAIFGWPGAGNPFFEEYNGFSLPALDPGYAPFYDRNNNGTYDPQEGEYPLPAGLPPDKIPEQITWHVFNDVRLHQVTQGQILKAEFQQTTYAFYCPDNSILNNTIFAEFRIVNRSSVVYDSLFFGLWTDPEIGCYTDDRFGCSRENNGFFSYNADALDGIQGNSCQAGIYPYFGGPPATSASFMTGELSAFTYYENASFFPAEIGPPKIDFQFYNFLNGQWGDGVPFTEGGIGYSTDPGAIETQFAFPGDPNNPTSWIMTLEDYGIGNCVAASKIGALEPGENVTRTLAFAFHRDPSRNHLGNVALMFEEVPKIRQQFIAGFDLCTADNCVNGCVWAGDANNDGIVDHNDLLLLGLANGKTGPARNSPLTWAPYSAENWSVDVIEGVNMKYVDLDGDGKAQIGSDIGIMETNYGLTHDDYPTAIEYSALPGILVEGGFAQEHPSTLQSLTSVYLDPDAIDELYGIAFIVLYDTAYFRDAYVDSWSAFANGGSSTILKKYPGKLEYAAVRTLGTNEQVNTKARMMRLMFSMNPNGLTPGINDTTALRIANIRGILNDGSEVPLGANQAQYVFLEGPTGVHDISANSINVFPNPSSGNVTIEISEDLVGATFSVADAIGREIQNGNFESTHTELELTAGVSFLVIHTDRERLVQKVIILE